MHFNRITDDQIEDLRQHLNCQKELLRWIKATPSLRKQLKEIDKDFLADLFVNVTDLEERINRLSSKDLRRRWIDYPEIAETFQFIDRWLVRISLLNTISGYQQEAITSDRGRRGGTASGPRRRLKDDDGAKAYIRQMAKTLSRDGVPRHQWVGKIDRQLALRKTPKDRKTIKKYIDNPFPKPSSRE